IEEYSKDNFLNGFKKAVRELEGSYALAVISTKADGIYLARKSSPLVIGIGKGEMFCASDIPALLDHTRSVIFLDDEEITVLTKDGAMVYDKSDKQVEKKAYQVDWTADMAMKEGYEHFMLKEIEEQRNTVRQSLTNDDEIHEAVRLMKQYKKFQVVASGTSYYAGLVLKFLIQKLAKVPCEAIIGSEYPYATVVDKDTLVIAISQSGETADTLRAVKEAKKFGAKILAVTNVVGSTLTREADKTVYMRAGPEISVVATKTYTSQLAVLSHLVFKFINHQELDEKLKEVWEIVEQALTKDKEIQEVAKKLKNLNNFFFIGRGIDFPTALEGALKLKEITYLHAEGYPGGELKHGPLSLLEKNVPVIAIVSSKETQDKMVGNIKECKARGALLIGISNNDELLEHVDIKIKMPEVHPLMAPIIYAIPVQLLAYYIAVLNGKDPDKPRNLAKSLTVE
ncbi:glutamine--fructose-6-phosphate transaminase (isomerizing), partial [Candidatus Micrarchaeota archaeon]|nr:glutamine--fructose-6-phosphate transaminase (isomerizing) [Candidatus Micrarchaeota archaeon]